MEQEQPMKTIAQIAKEIGVSKTAVWKRMRKKPLKNNIDNQTQTIGNTVYVNHLAETLIKKDFVDNQLTITNDNQSETIDNQLTINNDEIIDLLKEQIDNLNRQVIDLLNELKKEHEHSREISDKLAELAANAQRLHASEIMLPKKRRSLLELMGIKISRNRKTNKFD